MLTIHHLRVGRSLFTVWLLEELELTYGVVEYLRDPDTMRAPPELKSIHPLGKSPVIDDGGLVLSETAAITAYLLQKHDSDHRLWPDPANLEDWARYTQWLHYPEGSVFTPLLFKLLSARTGGTTPILDGFADPEVKAHFDHIAAQLGDNEFILGDSFSGADFGISYMLSMGDSLGLLAPWPTLVAYLERNKARPAFQRALERVVD
ncbi:MAG: glutathione S-transferase [Halieaceae bacterium]|jgi:glutathione S-transferase